MCHARDIAGLYVWLSADLMFCCFFFFNDTATTEIYTLSLHDALPISLARHWSPRARTLTSFAGVVCDLRKVHERSDRDRKSTRLNSSHANISYAVFCLKKKKPHQKDILPQLLP